MIASAYFFKKYWQRYRKRLPSKYGGESEMEISPTTLWRQHFFGELLSRAWGVLMRDIMRPDLWVELETFTRYWECRRAAYMKRGGFLTTTTGKPRELFTSTGKPRKLGDRPDVHQYDDCIRISYGKYERMTQSGGKLGKLVSLVSKAFTWLGILEEKHREEKAITSEDAIILALSGTITGQVGGRAEVRWRTSKMYSRGAESKKGQERLEFKHLLTGRRSLKEKYDHFLNGVYGLASRYGRLPPILST